MNLIQVIFVIVISAVVALLEIQIEGTGGWAKNLPKWEIKNPFKKIVGWPTLLDGYHFWSWVLILIVFHTPFFFGLSFNRTNELLVIEMLIIFLQLEDFLWFVFNPAWGIKKFFTQEIPWHGRKILFLPKNYWIYFIFLGIFEVVKNLLT